MTRAYRERESESGVAPKLCLGLNVDAFTLVIDATASPQKLTWRCTWLGAFQVELGGVVFLIPLELRQAVLAVEDVGVDGVAQLGGETEQRRVLLVLEGTVDY